MTPTPHKNQECERFKDLAFAFKDQATHHDINVNRKLLRILRELDDRITKLEKSK